jgi:hypothetical protein
MAEEDIGAPSIATKVVTLTDSVADSMLGEVRFAVQIFAFAKGSVYVWLGAAVGGAELSSMTASFPVREASVETQVFPLGVASETNEADFARRLGKRLGGRPSFVSLHIPPTWPQLLVARVQARATERVLAALAPAVSPSD